MKLLDIMREIESCGIQFSLLQEKTDDWRVRVHEPEKLKNYLDIEGYKFEILKGYPLDKATMVYVKDRRKVFTDTDGILDFIIKLKTESYA